MPRHLVLFDCDGTLVDSQFAIREALVRSFRSHGLPEPSLADVRTIIGLPLVTAIQRLVPDASHAMVEQLAVGYRTIHLEVRAAGAAVEPLFPGIVDALDVLSADGATLGIATGKGHRGLIHTLDCHGLRDRFATLQTADGGPGKPHPRMVLDALAETGMAAANTVVVGDTVFDAEMAHNAGVAIIGVSWGYHTPDALRAAGVDRIVERPADVPHAVAQLFGTGG